MCEADAGLVGDVGECDRRRRELALCRHDRWDTGGAAVAAGEQRGEGTEACNSHKATQPAVAPKCGSAHPHRTALARISIPGQLFSVTSCVERCNADHPSPESSWFKAAQQKVKCTPPV